MENIPEHPIVKNLLIFGNPYGQEEKIPSCPICGEETEKFYINLNFEVLGCEHCIKEIDSWELW